MKIRILFTIPNFDTAGSGKALLNIASGLNKNKFEPHILCKHDKGEFFKTVETSGIPIHVFDYETPMRPILKGLTGCWAISRRFKKIKPDIVHSFHYSADYSEALSAKMAGIKWVFTKKNMSWGGSSANAWKIRSFLADRIAIQNTDMAKQFYPNSQKTNLVPRGVNINQFQPRVPEKAIRLAMDTPDDARIVICVANMVPVKGVELLIQAFASLAVEHPNWYLWLVGDISSEYGKELMTLTLENNLSERIRFSGKQSNVRSYLDHAEIFVLPTKDEGRREGSPVALLEAMANGKVVIASAVPGVKDQLENFVSNQFKPGDANDLREKLRLLMSNSTEENVLFGQYFQNYMVSKFTIEHEIEQHEHFYLKLLNG